MISIYANDRGSGHARVEETKMRARALLGFWGGRFLSDVNEGNCRRYVTERATVAAARRELEDLRAAVNYHHQQGLATELVRVWLPEAPQSRSRWLTRSEAARLLWALWRSKDKLTKCPNRRHIARFMLAGLYTGTRASRVCGAAVRPTVGYGYVDLDKGVFYRKDGAERATKKRQTPVRLAPRLLAHMRRWVRLGIARQFFVEWRGKPVKSVRSGWNSARTEAGLGPDVVRHTLRHTAATWLMQNRTSPWEAAGYLGMSVGTLLKNYGHHHPDHMREAAENISRSAPVSPQKRADAS